MKDCILVKLPDQKDKIYFHKKSEKVYSKGKELPNQKKWLKKLYDYASEMSDEYGQNFNDKLWDRTRKALEKTKQSSTKKTTKKSTNKTLKSFFR
jgi:hypothetical protein